MAVAVAVGPTLHAYVPACGYVAGGFPEAEKISNWLFQWYIYYQQARVYMQWSFCAALVW